MNIDFIVFNRKM